MELFLLFLRFEIGKIGKTVTLKVYLVFRVFLNPTHEVKFVLNCIVLRNFIGVCRLSRAWQGGAGASVSWSDWAGDLSSAPFMSGSNLCVGGLWVGLIPGVAGREQGAIAAKISNVQVQDYLPGEAGHWPRDSPPWGDHSRLGHFLLWIITNQKNLLFMQKHKKESLSDFSFCESYADWPYFLTQSRPRWLEIERLSKRLGVTDEEKSKHTSFQQLSVRL